MEADDRQVTTVFIVQTSFHYRHSTEYHEALPSSVTDEVRRDCTFADDGNTFTIIGLSSADGGMTVGL